jgi:hypothetical protein
MCTQYLHFIHPPTSFPHLFPYPTATNPSSGRTCSALLFSDFIEEKKMLFLFVWDSYTGSFLVTFPWT